MSIHFKFDFIENFEFNELPAALYELFENMTTIVDKMKINNAHKTKLVYQNKKTDTCG